MLHAINNIRVFWTPPELKEIVCPIEEKKEGMISGSGEKQI